MISVLFIGLSLSMDAFAVSVSSGISARGLRAFHALRACFFFGLFQFMMPVAGYFLGAGFAAYISTFDHWIAFGLLAFIGGKMLWEALKAKPAETAPDADAGSIASLKSLVILAVATSIDALAVGVSFSVLRQGIWLESAFIGVITFAVCVAGFWFGKHAGTALQKWAPVTGGVVLIGIGAKILLEHLLV